MRLPSADLAAALQTVSGAECRCPGADHDQLLSLLRQWQALESWAAAGKLGVLQALIREEDQPLPGGGYHGDLPDGWTKSLTHEAALALAMPPQSAEKLMWTAWNLRARLPETGALLARGTLTLAKARAVDEALSQLTDEDAAEAEAMIVPELPGKTFGQAEKLAVQAALTVDPESATRRRAEAERNRARVMLRRDPSGAASLVGYDLPTDEALAGHANVCARADEYKASNVFPGVRMDQLRAMAYLDLVNEITTEARIACGQPPSGLGAPNEYGPDPDECRPGGGPVDDGGPTREDPDGGPTREDPDGGPTREDPDGGPATGDPDGGDPGRDGPGGGGSPASPPSRSPSSPPSSQPPAPRSARLADLVIPLSTLLGLSERPGEGHALGPLDPDLCRSLAVTAANSRHTTICLTVTDPDGIAIGHGCTRPDRRKPSGRGGSVGQSHPDRQKQTDHTQGSSARSQRSPFGPFGPHSEHGGRIEHDEHSEHSGHSGRIERIEHGEHGEHGEQGPPGPLASLRARVNLTVTAACLTELARPARAAKQDTEDARQNQNPEDARQNLEEPVGGPSGWFFARTADPGPPGGFGSWILALPDGRDLALDLGPVPTYECDHRHESHAYQPNDTLRHLVQIRDQVCTFPTCSRHARESDYEHAIPYDKGGRTCACNAGARSRACHQVKQSPGWNVTQPKPGFHQWTTPSGRVYVQEPKRYPT
jgi:hypothetical protein